MSTRRRKVGSMAGTGNYFKKVYKSIIKLNCDYWSNLSSDSWRAHHRQNILSMRLLEVVSNHVISMGGPIGVQ